MAEYKVGQFTVRPEDAGRNVSIELIGDIGCTAVYELKLTVEEEDFGKQVEVLWHEHMLGQLNFWSPTARRDHALKQWFAARVNKSRLYYGAPVISVYENGGRNFRTVAVSEAEKPVELSVCVNDFDQKEELGFALRFTPDCRETRMLLRIDSRPLAYTDCVADIADWWRTFYPCEQRTGGTCELPLYSNWYSYHQNPQQESLEREMEAAAKLGFRSLIIDDGWSYDGPGTGDYFNCGSWKVVGSKFPDFKAFVDKAHALDIKVALWFPVPFIGRNDPEYPLLEDKLLYYAPEFRAGVLDPRRTDVREYIVGTYERIVNEYGLDGLKLDFIDSFLTKDAKPSEGNCATVEEGITRLLSAIETRLRAKNPDFMIEFRQYYEGPSITRHCNMLRVGDCAFDTMTNRIGMVDLRIYNYPLAVHADMFLWAHDERPAVCARMLLNTLFAVPQISVLLQDATPEQSRVIRNYIAYWAENSELLLHRRIQVTDPECNYTTVSVESEVKRITAVYTQHITRFDGKRHEILNATEYDSIYTDVRKKCNAAIYDCFGNRISCETLECGLHELYIPSGGRAVLEA